MVELGIMMLLIGIAIGFSLGFFYRVGLSLGELFVDRFFGDHLERVARRVKLREYRIRRWFTLRTRGLGRG